MTNTHGYNPQIYFALRSVFYGLIIVVVLSAVASTYYSVTGVIYNPIFELPAALINQALGKSLLPTSIAEFIHLNNITDFYSLGDILVSAIYLIVVSFATFFLIWSLGQHFAISMDDYCLRYKLGTEGAKEYKKDQRAKMEAQQNINDAETRFESAQRQYWQEWKRFYQSDLSYEEWKEKTFRN